jgi:CRISPR system Cascade subunit CasE
VEKDLFLLHADHHADEPLSRAQIYTAWAQAQLDHTHAVRVTAIRLAGFRLTRQMRRPQTMLGQAKQFTRPQAVLTGTLIVQNPDAFTALLAHGIGRHRAFGYGMLLLRPAR